jgi:hypothetical protein
VAAKVGEGPTKEAREEVRQEQTSKPPPS